MSNALKIPLCLLVCSIALAGCGGDDEGGGADQPAQRQQQEPQEAQEQRQQQQPEQAAPGPQQEPQGDPTSPSEIADRYALKLSGGERTGCTSAQPGAEAAGHPGCIFAAAFSGCLSGLKGRQIGGDPAEQFPEAELQAISERAYRECAAQAP